jgi:hypothetical protein
MGSGLRAGQIGTEPACPNQPHSNAGEAPAFFGQLQLNVTFPQLPSGLQATTGSAQLPSAHSWQMSMTGHCEGH